MRHGFAQLATLGIFCTVLSGPARAETVMQQCGHQYQDAKAAGTLKDITWNQFSADCATRRKAQPASTTAADPAPAATPAAQTSNPLNPAPAATPVSAPAPAAAPTTTATKSSAPAATGGRAAFVVREKQCGAEWRANKATLKTQTPGLTWPKYLSQCNTRLKAAGK